MRISSPMRFRLSTPFPKANIQLEATFPHHGHSHIDTGLIKPYARLPLFRSL